MIKNRRKYPRHNLVYTVSYSTQGLEAEPVYTKSFDVSLGGISIILKDFILNPGEVMLSIYGPDKENPVKAKGRIVWQGNVPRSGEKRAGIQFTKVKLDRLKTLLEISSTE